jgi:hypothetical protein
MSTVDLESLPVEEKLKLMESLWDSLCRPSVPDDLRMPAWHAHVLEERERRLTSGEDGVSPWAEAKERIRTRIKSA